MRHLATALFVVVGLVNFAPVIGVLGAARLESLYGVPVVGDERGAKRAHGRPGGGDRGRDVQERYKSERAAESSASKSGSSEVPYRHAPRMMPSRSTRNALRSDTPSRPRKSCATSKPLVASPFQSESSGTSMSSACAHAMWQYGESREMPYAVVPASSKSALLSRRSVSSSVQVPVQSKR